MMIYGVFEHVAMNKPVMAALIAAGTAFLASLVSFLSCGASTRIAGLFDGPAAATQSISHMART